MAKKKVKGSTDLKIISEEQPAFIARTAEFFVRNRDTVGYLVVAVIIIATVGFLMRMNSQAKENEASVQFKNAVNQYQKDMAASSISFEAESENKDAESPEMKVKTKSIGAFQSVYDNYSGTEAGRHALYMMAVSQLNQGRYEEAIDTFDNYLSKYPETILAGSSSLGKATAQFNLERFQESLETLNTLETKYPDFKLKDVVQYEKAKRLEALERTADARAAYEMVIEQYPDSAWKSLSEQAIEKLDEDNQEPLDDESA